MLKKENLLKNEYDDVSTSFDVIFEVILFVVAFILCSMVLIKSFWLKPYYISGSSMVQTLDSGDWVLANTALKPNREDVVIVYNPIKKIIVVKRVIGLPGDTIYFDENGFIYDKTEDGFEVRKEQYAYYSRTTLKGEKITEVKVGDDEVFVVGDNRLVSSDSRQNGAFKLADVKGVVTDWVIENRKSLKWLYPYI